MINQKLRGFVGQKLGGPKNAVTGSVTIIRKTTPGAYTLGPYPYDQVVTVALYGAGGACNSGSVGAGGGAAAMVRDYVLGAGRTLPYYVGGSPTAGGNGGDTWCQFPDRLVTAGGGRGANNGSAGGVATGGDLNRKGGAAVSGDVGSPGEFGGIGGLNAYPGSGSGGGGSGGFNDQGDWPYGDGVFYVGTPGQNSGASIPGGGAGNGTSGEKGADGMAYIILRRAS